MKQGSKDIHKYDDIINMPRHISTHHTAMPADKRAAQFAPFKAVSDEGFDVINTPNLEDDD